MNRLLIQSFATLAVLTGIALQSAPALAKSFQTQQQHHESSAAFVVVSGTHYGRGNHLKNRWDARRVERLLGRNDSRNHVYSRKTDRHYRRYGQHRNDASHYGQRAVGRARWYANQATAQANTARRLGCHRSGPRWTTDWHDHYSWALDASPRKLRRETRRREERIQECLVRHQHHGRAYRHLYPHH